MRGGEAEGGEGEVKVCVEGDLGVGDSWGGGVEVEVAMRVVYQNLEIKTSREMEEVSSPHPLFYISNHQEREKCKEVKKKKKTEITHE